MEPSNLILCPCLPPIASIVEAAAKTDSIQKEQCTACYIDNTAPHGIDLCLKTFQGFCVTQDLTSVSATPSGSKGHAFDHKQATGNHLVLNIRKKIEMTKRESTEITKLAINKQGGGGDDFIEVPVMEYSLKCYKCLKSVDVDRNDPKFSTLIRTIEDKTSSGMKEKIKAWELEILPCDHSRNVLLTRQIYNASPKVKVDFSNIKCAECDMRTNIWLCLVCGYMGCGRKHFDGSGGNGHFKEHHEKTKHPLGVKIGTIGGSENVSSYCYLCNNDVKVENLLPSMSEVFGDEVNKLRKTEKTINEMSLEINLNFELSKAFEEKEQLVALNQIKEKNFFWGIANIGNSCYLNSVVQALSGYKQFISKLTANSSQNGQKSKAVEVAKLFHGIRRKSDVTPEMLEILGDAKTTYKPFHYMPRPYKFREIMANDHPEFKTSRQQDAAEYLIHLLTQLSCPEVMKPLAKDFFRVPTANKLICSSCKSFYIREAETIALKVELPYDKIQKVLAGEKKVDLKELLTAEGLINGDEVIRCEKCQGKKVFDSRVFLRGLPQNVVMVVKPFYIEGLTAKKMNLEIGFDEGERVQLGSLRLTEEMVLHKLGELTER